MAIAHVPLSDGLPLVPLPHLLAAGIGLLVASLLAVGGVTLAAIAMLRLEREVEPYRQNLRRLPRKLKPESKRWPRSTNMRPARRRQTSES